MKRFGLLILFCLLCTACTALPAEERSFAVVLGIGRTDGQWIACARVPTYQTSGGYTTVTGEGETMEAALAAIDAASPMQLHLGQLRLLIFTAELARSDAFPSVIRTLSARHDLRLKVAVAVTDAELIRLMDAMEPANGSRLSKSLDVLIETRISQGTTVSSTLSDVIRMGERQSPVLIRVTLPGKEPVLSGCWPLSHSGVVTEPLAPDETQLLSLMLGRMTSGTLSLAEGTARINAAESCAELEGLQQASVRLTLRCSAASLMDGALSQALADECLGVLNRLSAMGSDALGLGRQAIVHVADMAQWHVLDWPLRYRDMNWSVRAGVTGRTE